MKKAYLVIDHFKATKVWPETGYDQKPSNKSLTLYNANKLYFEFCLLIN